MISASPIRVAAKVTAGATDALGYIDGNGNGQGSTQAVRIPY